MSYINEALSDGETLIYRANVSPKYFLGLYIAMACLGLVGVFCLLSPGGHNMALFLALVIVAMYAQVLIAYRCTEIGITNRRFIAKTGFIQRNTFEIALNKVESIQVNQDIVGRLLGYGTIIVSGTGTSHAPLRGIDNPLEFRRKFDEVSTRAN